MYELGPDGLDTLGPNLDWNIFCGHFDPQDEDRHFFGFYFPTGKLPFRPGNRRHFIDPKHLHQQGDAVTVTSKVASSFIATLMKSGAEAGAEICGAVRLEGVVELGDARAWGLGYAMVDTSVPDEEIRNGVWAERDRLRPEGHDQTCAPAVSARCRTTYSGKGARLSEAWLLCKSGNLYGHIVEVALDVFLRGKRPFLGRDEHPAQICDDMVCLRSPAAGTGRAICGPRGQAREPAGKSACRSSLGHTQCSVPAEVVGPAGALRNQEAI
jgi:hypothetical protein